MVLRFIHILKIMHLQQSKGKQSSKLEKWYIKG